jgi:hypothetical protein
MRYFPKLRDWQRNISRTADHVIREGVPRMGQMHYTACSTIGTQLRNRPWVPADELMQPVSHLPGRRPPLLRFRKSVHNDHL